LFIHNEATSEGDSEQFNITVPTEICFSESSGTIWQIHNIRLSQCQHLTKRLYCYYKQKMQY